MQIKESVNPIQTISCGNNSPESNKRARTLYDLLEHTLNSKSNSRPPKMELTGTLVPCNGVAFGRRFKFKLETDSDDFILRMSAAHTFLAKKMAWEEVTVKGYLSEDDGFFEVEKINLAEHVQSYVL